VKRSRLSNPHLANIRVRAIKDLIDAFKTAAAGYKARVQRQKTQQSRWQKKKETAKLKGGRKWKKRKYEIHYKSRRLTSDSFGFEPKSIKVEGDQLKLFSTTPRFGMQTGIQMSEAGFANTHQSLLSDPIHIRSLVSLGTLPRRGSPLRNGRALWSLRSWNQVYVYILYRRRVWAHRL
jgi:hypothetical protein